MYHMPGRTNAQVQPRSPFARRLSRPARQRGFTLLELMIVVVIIGILVGIGLPGYQNSVQRSVRSDGKAALMAFAQAMELRYQQNYNYLGAAAGGSDTGSPDPLVFASQAPLDGDNKAYDLTIDIANPAPPYFRVRATPIAGGRMDGDGVLEIDSLGRRGWDRNGDGDTTDANEDTWER